MKDDNSEILQIHELDGDGIPRSLNGQRIAFLIFLIASRRSQNPDSVEDRFIDVPDSIVSDGVNGTELR